MSHPYFYSDTYDRFIRIRLWFSALQVNHRVLLVYNFLLLSSRAALVVSIPIRGGSRENRYTMVVQPDFY